MLSGFRIWLEILPRKVVLLNSLIFENETVAIVEGLKIREQIQSIREKAWVQSKIIKLTLLDLLRVLLSIMGYGISILVLELLKYQADIYMSK